MWIGLHSDRLFKSFRTKRVKVLQEPMNHAWAYDIKFSDPDGIVLWLGTEPKQGLPFDD